MSTKKRSNIPPEVLVYLEKITSGTPGGVECGYCHFSDTLALVSTKWKKQGENLYNFIQVCQCSKCGHKQGYTWDQTLVSTETHTAPE